MLNFILLCTLTVIASNAACDCSVTQHVQNVKQRNVYGEKEIKKIILALLFRSSLESVLDSNRYVHVLNLDMIRNQKIQRGWKLWTRNSSVFVKQNLSSKKRFEEPSPRWKKFIIHRTRHGFLTHLVPTRTPVAAKSTTLVPLAVFALRIILPTTLRNSAAMIQMVDCYQLD